jgi:hypothetical protein
MGVLADCAPSGNGRPREVEFIAGRGGELVKAYRVHVIKS